MSFNNPKKIVSTALLLLILVSAYTADLDEDEMRRMAELHYETAVDLYSIGNCRSAIFNSERSLSLYTQLSDQNGVLKASIILNQVNNCLRTEGDGYYVDAVQMYSGGSTYFDTGEYESARDRFEEARSEILEANTSYYLMSPPDRGLLNKTNELYLDIEGRLREIALLNAEEIYDLAKKSYFNYEPPKYTTAKKYAEDALEIYNLYNYSDGIYKAQQLLMRINADIKGIRIYADDQSELARNAYEKRNYLGAMEKYKKAKDAYILIERAGEAADCANMMELIEKLVAADANALKKQADEYLEKAQLCYIGYDYENATLYLDQAEMIYTQLTEFARLYHDVAKEKQYASLISECHNLEIKIDTAVHNEIISMEAEKLYSESYDHFKSGSYENASVLVNEAWSLYSSISKYGGMSKCEFLNGSINDKLGETREAFDYYNTSLSFYSKAYFENATYYADKSLAIYMNITRDKESEMVRKLIQNIHAGVGKKKDADEHYTKALDFNELDKLDTAADEAWEAKKLYEEINWGPGVEKSRGLIELINEKKTHWSIIEMLRFLVPIVIFLVVVVVVIRWTSEREKRRREEREKTEGEKRREKEERLRKIKETEARRYERKQAVEEERKKRKKHVTEARKDIEKSSMLERLREEVSPKPGVKESMGDVTTGKLAEQGGRDKVAPPKMEELLDEWNNIPDESMEAPGERKGVLLKKIGESKESMKKSPIESGETEIDKPPELLRERYAAGEISRDEFLHTQNDLESGGHASPYTGERKGLGEDIEEGKSAISIERERVKKKDDVLKEMLKEEREKHMKKSRKKKKKKKKKKRSDEEIANQISEIKDFLGNKD